MCRLHYIILLLLIALTANLLAVSFSHPTWGNGLSVLLVLALIFFNVQYIRLTTKEYKSKEKRYRLKTPSPATDETPDTANASSAKNVLLLAEDDKDMREYLTESLSEEYQVISVSDGATLLAMANEVNPDIIISDHFIPVLRGDEVCRRLKSSMETSHIPFILLSALKEKEYVILGLEAGANDYIIKPFDFSILKARIRNIIQSREHLRETVLSTETRLGKCGLRESI